MVKAKNWEEPRDKQDSDLGGRINKVWQSKAVYPAPVVDEISQVKNRRYFKISLWKLRSYNFFQ